MTRLHLLLIDDDRGFLRRFEAFGSDRFRITTADSGDAGLLSARRDEPDAVLLDIDLGRGKDGFQILRELKAFDPGLPVIMVTGDDAQDTAVRAIGAGADDFITKSPDLAVLEAKLTHALELSAWRHHALDLQSEGARELVGDSPPMRLLRAQIAKIGPTKMRVLLRGETGAGKEPVARALHAASTRRNEKFMPMNAAVGTDELFDSSIFGHEKGAFTDAHHRHRGKLEVAHGGTFFLDEIGKMSVARQSKLLRVVETGRFERLGGTEEIFSDVRWITAANENLAQRMKEGSFLEDLYHRVGELTVDVPPLREHLEDIPALARVLLDDFARREGSRPATWEDGALAPLWDHDWPGNVRQLGKVLGRAVVFASSDRLTTDDVARALASEEGPIHLSPTPLRDGGAVGPAIPAAADLDAARRAFDRWFLSRELARNGGSVKQTAERLKIVRQTLHKLLKDLGIRGRSDDEPGPGVD